MKQLLNMEDVQVRIKTHTQEITALELEHLTLHEGELVALVGETGSGKSMTASSIMQLFPTQKAYIGSGQYCV
ncbi:UNVERIFIED_CONTAM: ABC-type microcin C transport system duplicated ATPase subunit YejF [Brevibacillus sp. OAP136]